MSAPAHADTTIYMVPPLAPVFCIKHAKWSSPLILVVQVYSQVSQRCTPKTFDTTLLRMYIAYILLKKKIFDNTLKHSHKLIQEPAEWPGVGHKLSLFL